MNKDGDRGRAAGVQIAVGAKLGFLILAAAWAAAGEPPAPRPTPTPTPSPTPTPAPTPRAPAQAGPPRPRLRLDLEKHVRKQVEAEAQAAPPRFTDSVEVEGQTPQSVLDRQLQGLPLDCGPSGGGEGGGAPTEAETRAVRPHSSPYLDFLPLAKKLRDRFKKKQPDRYFLYRVRRPEGVKYDLRTERVPDAWLHNSPENTYELVEAFPDLGDATRALRRLEAGFDRAVSPFKESPPQPWATQQPCRPK